MTPELTCQLVDYLGGTSSVAKITGATMQSVRNWKRDGIPPARLDQIKLKRATKWRAFKALHPDAA